MITILGIGVFAIPSVLIGVAFVDEIRKERELAATKAQENKSTDD